MTAEQQGMLNFAIALAVVGYIRARRRWRGDGGGRGVHGSGSLATDADLRRNGLLSRGIAGLPLGRTLGRGEMIYRHDYCHSLYVAPPGAGKGVSVAIPTLLTWKGGSVVVNDNKGELFRATAKRRAAMGQKVVCIDPFGVVGGKDTCNPLRLAPPGVQGVDFARACMEAMVQRTGEEKDPTWNDNAANFGTGILAYCLGRGGAEANFQTFREIAANPLLQAACAESLINAGGVYANLGGVMLAPAREEAASIRSALNRHTTFLDSPSILPVLRDGWNPLELLDGNTTVYLILPPHQLSANGQARWLRLMFSSVFRMIIERGMKKGATCLAVIDEAGQVGKFDPLIQALTLGRASGIRGNLFVQSLGQLKSEFREHEQTVLDSCELVCWGTNSLEQAKRISEMIGNYTETSVSYTDGENDNHGHTTGQAWSSNHGRGRSSSTTVSRHARAVLTPDEVLNVSPYVLFAFLRGLPPIACSRILYYQDPLFTGKRRPLPLWARLLVATAFGMAALVVLKSFAQ